MNDACEHQGRMMWKDISRRGAGAQSWKIERTDTLLWDGYNIIRETINHQPSTTNHYVWGLDLSCTLQGAGGVGGLLAEVQNGAHYFAAFDANGNVTEYISTNGVTEAHYEYSPFGEIVVQSGELADSFTHRFSTKPWCGVTGLSEYEFRKCSPSLGRWQSRAPLGDHASPGARILHGVIAVRMAFAAIVNLHISRDEALDDYGRLSAALNALYWIDGMQTLGSGDPSIGMAWFDPFSGRSLSIDAIGLSGGLSQYMFCRNNPVKFVDPDGKDVRLEAGNDTGNWINDLFDWRKSL